MAEDTEAQDTQETPKPATGPGFVEEAAPSLDPTKEDPGILESYGTFPVWMLKTIHILTPDFLIRKTPPKKKLRI